MNTKVSGSYDGEVEDISVDEPCTDTSTSDIEVADSDLDSCVDRQLSMGGSENLMSATQHKTLK
jgi:hypothetical protein